MRAVVVAPLLLGGARLTRTPIRPRGRAFLAAGPWMATYQVCYFSAVPLAAVAALLAIRSDPVLVTLLGCFWVSP